MSRLKDHGKIDLLTSYCTNLFAQQGCAQDFSKGGGRRLVVTQALRIDPFISGFRYDILDNCLVRVLIFSKKIRVSKAPPPSPTTDWTISSKTTTGCTITWPHHATPWQGYTITGRTMRGFTTTGCHHNRLHDNQFCGAVSFWYGSRSCFHISIIRIRILLYIWYISLILDCSKIKFFHWNFFCIGTSKLLLIARSRILCTRICNDRYGSGSGQMIRIRIRNTDYNTITECTTAWSEAASSYEAEVVEPVEGAACCGEAAGVQSVVV